MLPSPVGPAPLQVASSCCLSVTRRQHTSLPASQSKHQPASQSTDQPASQPASQSTDQLTSQPVNTPASQPVNRPANQPASQHTCQPVNTPASQSTHQPAKHKQPETKQTTGKQAAFAFIHRCEIIVFVLVEHSKHITVSIKMGHKSAST